MVYRTIITLQRVNINIKYILQSYFIFLLNYSYYANNDFTLKNFLIGLLVYMFAFDTWFYFTHVALHHPLGMKYVHN